MQQLKKFILLLSTIVNAPRFTKSILVSNQKCEIQPALIRWHPNEYSQESDSFLDSYFGLCNTLIDLSSKV